MRALFVVLALALCGLAQASTCSVSEFANASPILYQAATAPPLAAAVVTYTTSSVQSSVFQDLTQLVRVQCDAVGYITFGTNPTATLTSVRLSANVAEYFAVPKYSGFKLAVIGP